MSDWQIGDLALCVSNGPDPDHWLSEGGGPLRGSVSTVASVEFHPEEDGNLDGLWLGFEGFGDVVFFHLGFRKVTPESADEFDRETIALMKEKVA